MAEIFTQISEVFCVAKPIVGPCSIAARKSLGSDGVEEWIIGAQRISDNSGITHGKISAG